MTSLHRGDGGHASACRRRCPGAAGDGSTVAVAPTGPTVQAQGRRWLRSRHQDEAGSVVLWLLGVAITILVLGGLSIDLWRVFSDRRALVGVADAAAYAGASGLDVDAFRRGEGIVLSPAVAAELATATIAAQADTSGLESSEVAVAPDGSRVTVRLTGTVDLMLMKLLRPGRDAIELEVVAVAEPRLGG